MVWVFASIFLVFTKCVKKKQQKQKRTTELRATITTRDNSKTFKSPQKSGLLNWVRKLREKTGPLSPQRYTGIVCKARTKKDLLDIVFDFEKQIGKVDGIFLAAAAHTAANIDSCPPSVAASLLSKIPKHESVSKGVSISALNKAANAQDVTSARMAFDVLKKTDLEGAWSGLLRACFDNHSAGHDVLEEMLVDFVCHSKLDLRVLGSMLKCAGNVNQFDVVERVWKWSQPMRKHRLDGGGGKDCDVALQFHTICDSLFKTWSC